MKVVVIMPPFGDTVQDGTVVEWLREVGDAVNLGDSLCTVESDKSSFDIECKATGTIAAVLVREGETVDVGTPLCEIDVRD